MTATVAPTAPGDAAVPAAAPGTYPVPAGRGRWRLTLHRRSFSGNATWDQTIVGELTSARSRQVVQQLNTPAELRFTIDGRAPDAATIQELQHDVYAWRWDDQTGKDVAVFRGVVDHSEDVISDRLHVVNVVAHDYLALVARRFVMELVPVVMTQFDQDVIAANLISRAGGGPYPVPDFRPGSITPLAAVVVTPGGANRGKSGVLRDRTYAGQKNLGEALDQLANVSGGFDYDVIPEPQAPDNMAMIDQYQPDGIFPLGGGRDAVRLFWPSQGVARTDVFLQYGGNVASLTRTVNSADYANYVRSLGNNSSSDPNMPQFTGEASNADASGQTVGFWPYADNAGTDVTLLPALAERAAGLLVGTGILVPSYTVALRPGRYVWGAPNMGDTVPLIVNSGRLAVNTTVRVVGITYDVGDDGEEDVELTVGRPLTTLTDLLARTNTAVSALGRR